MYFEISRCLLCQQYTLLLNKSTTKEEELDVCAFLRYSFPEIVNEFRLYNEFQSLGWFFNFKETIFGLSQKVRFTFGLWDFKLTASDLSDILDNFNKVNHLDLYRNTFEDFNEDINVSKDKEFAIKGIDLRWCSGLDIKKMTEIIRALSKNKSIIKNLEYVWVTGSQLDVRQLQIMFALHKFNVLIW